MINRGVLSTVLITCLIGFVTGDNAHKVRRVARGGRYPCGQVRLPNGRAILRYRELALFRCNAGFRLVGTGIARCRNGEWNEQLPICVAPGCPNVTTSLPPELEVTRLQYAGSMITFRCKDGLTLSGSKMIFCNGSEWNDTIPTCFGAPAYLPATPTPGATYHSCDFEDGRCNWTEESRNDVFNWTRHYMTYTRMTGPSVDHTTGITGGHFLFIETSPPRVCNDSARIISPVFPPSWSDSCFDFWYHMLVPSSSDGITGSLVVYVVRAGLSTEEVAPSFHKKGNQHDVWHLGQIDIPRFTESFQIIIEGIRGNMYANDIAIDDLRLWNCPKDHPTTSTPTSDPTTVVMTTTGPSTQAPSSSTDTPHVDFPRSMPGTTTQKAINTTTLKPAVSTKLGVDTTTDSEEKFKTRASVTKETARGNDKPKIALPLGITASVLVALLIAVSAIMRIRIAH